MRLLPSNGYTGACCLRAGRLSSRTTSPISTGLPSRPLRAVATTRRFVRRHATVSSRATEPSLLSGSSDVARLDAYSSLPKYCPGCGAPTQTVAPEDAGYYSVNRRRVKTWLASTEPPDPLIEQGINCDRCENLTQTPRGVSIVHPSIQSIHDIIDESPSKHNHIYHILDAADLPMSLIPSLQRDLELPRLRTQNRRSKHMHYSKGRVADVNFIITRSDLLAPKKEQVDSLMNYLRELIREALGHSGKNVRLGNVSCVSATRDWWTQQLKDHVFSRGGAGWMVGKANVGKSRLFAKIFPKGRGGNIIGGRADEADTAGASQGSYAELSDLPMQDFAETSHEETSLLPPMRKEFTYPLMPIQSSLPGTTASPIRIPYGNGKGELIDLPGVARSGLEDFVRPECQQDIIMKSRIIPQQYTIKPGQSLLLGGGLLRITPTTPDLVFLVSPFTTLDVHVTSTVKAVDAEVHGPRSTISGVMVEGSHKFLKSAGRMKLKHDVTRQRSGPLTSKSVGKMKADNLSFIVWSADLVIEGIGWVELTAQTRRPHASQKPHVPNSLQRQRRSDALEEDIDDAFTQAAAADKAYAEAAEVAGIERLMPEFEVFSPHGRHVMLRKPMNASLLNAKKKQAKAAPGSRPRQSIRSLKGSEQGRRAALKQATTV